MVSVTRTGLRRASSATDMAGEIAAIAGVRPCWENEVISSIQVGLVTGQAVTAALVHQNATAHDSRSPAASCLFAAECCSSLQVLLVETALQLMLGEPCG